MAGLAIGPAHRKTGNGDRLASERLSSLLAVEDSPREAGAACCAEGGSGSDPDHESEQPALVCSADPRRVAQTRNRDHGTYCGPIHGATAEATFADLADLP